ncbi:MAG: inositol monophosphatase family protein [Pseudomonadota bacterium]
MLLDIVPSKVEAALREVAAEHVTPLFGNLDVGDVRSKSGPLDMVTAADVAAEAALTPFLLDLVPGSKVIGEEAASEDPSIVDALLGDGVFWTVDPVDGTRNFVAGREEFGSMVALIENGETVMGWIYFPMSGGCATAVKGEGAFFKDVRLKAGSDRAPGALIGDYSARLVEDANKDVLDANAPQLGAVTDIGCAARQYADLASGALDYVVWGKIYPWDHAPGALLFEEAGGRTAYIEGGAPYAPKPVKHKPMLSAPRDAWDEVHAHLLRPVA